MKHGLLSVFAALLLLCSTARSEDSAGLRSAIGGKISGIEFQFADAVIMPFSPDKDKVLISIMQEKVETAFSLSSKPHFILSVPGESGEYALGGQAGCTAFSPPDGNVVLSEGKVTLKRDKNSLRISIDARESSNTFISGDFIIEIKE